MPARTTSAYRRGWFGKRDNLIGEFDERWLQFNAGLDWMMTDRHEMRVKLQAIGLDAPLLQGYRVDASGNSIATDEPINDFSVRNLGLPDPLPLRACATVRTCTWCTAVAAISRTSSPVSPGSCCATAWNCATTSSWWSR
jgi:hypothetical protein